MPERIPSPGTLKKSRHPFIQAEVEEISKKVATLKINEGVKPEDINRQARSLTAHHLITRRIKQSFFRILQAQQKQMEEARKLAIIDPLTGLHNRRWFDEELVRRMAEAKRHDENIWVVLADIDYFKLVNDRHGHNKGDDVLKAFGNVGSRVEEPFARYGGEEFIKAMRNGHNTETIQITLSRNSILFGNQTESIIGSRETISYGIARMEPDDTAETLTRKADMAMYHSKKSGRDQISVFGGTIDNPQFTQLRTLTPNELDLGQNQPQILAREAVL